MSLSWRRKPDWEDPWHRPPPPRRGGGALLRVALAVAVLALVLTLILPPSLRPEGDATLILRAVILGAVLLLAVAQLGRGAARVIGDLMLWGGVIALLAGLFAWRDELRAVAEHATEQFSSGHPKIINPTTVSFRRSLDRQFWIDAAVGGRSVRFLVDTGASTIVLSRADALKLGIRPETLRFTQRFETAGGVTRGAAVTIPEIRIGPLSFSQVKASVTDGPLRYSLLGMGLLERLGSIEISRDTLTIRQ